ncbi:hypothetical protein INT47_000603 [Mucor saturninus]|uniref:Uncharacterized protein n=1 Tax=Mucor saturninus TaxID=64648 RepID=A0A8H7RKC8_9FUNG|nr:hypothetical protein INT47_000603 [Mucor saturninus]
MQDTESNKNERRHILSTLRDWNIGITPHGKLAMEPCFVQNSVPYIVYEQNTKTESTFICTKSEWTANLLESNTSNPCDTETIKSLSVCKSIFHPDTSLNTTVLHLAKYNVKAYIIVDNIARLTQDFMDELSKAEEHWPHSPQKSWDKLCLIWDKFGFLWPQRVQIGYKAIRKLSINEDTDIKNIKRDLEKSSQDILHNNQKDYSVIWRTSLKPMHEFFPARYTKTRDFINNIIHKFSNLVFHDSLFRLKNIRSGDYLSRQKSYHLDLSEVATVPASSNKAISNSNIFWKFNTSTEETSPYIFTGDSQLLCSGQFDITEPTFLSKSKQQNSLDRNRANISLIQYRQPKNQLTPSYDTDIGLKWEIDISGTAYHQHDDTFFDLDNSIKKLRCLVHGDMVTLSQQSLYLRSALMSCSSSTCKPNSIDSNRSTAAINTVLSPNSILSFSDQYNFSSCNLSESNSTQPTSPSNSVYVAGSLPNSKNRSYEINRSISQSPQGPLAFIESILQIDNIPSEYIWKIEMVSKTIINEENDDVTKSVKSLSLKSSTPDKPKIYSPGLNLAIMNSPISVISNDHNYSIPNINSNNYNISSLIPHRNNEENVKTVLSEQQQWYTKPQKSKWLNVNPKLYNLQKDLPEQDSIYSRYSTPLESIRSIPSPTHSFAPEMSKKKLGKQPLQATKAQTYHAADDSNSWSSSESHSPIDENTDIYLRRTSSPDLTEAESFKRGYQESHNEQNAHQIILQNLFSGSPISSTSQVRYYDDDEEVYLSSQVQSYTMTPRSRFSQQLTPSSSANLTPEEYMKRKMSRENSFMLLIDRETKEQFWLRAIKQSSLSQS